MTPDSSDNRIFDGLAKTDRTALLGLIVANLLPLILGLLFGWDIGSLIMFYWWENIIIGLYSILRIVFACGSMASAVNSLLANRISHVEILNDESKQIVEPSIHGQKFFLVPFFAFHYFFFCFIHGIFLLVFTTAGFNNGPMNIAHSPFEGNVLVNFWQALPSGGSLSLLALLISHGISFSRNYIQNGEFLESSPAFEMFRPYKRIIILHVCIVFGGFIIMLLGSSTIFVLLFVLLKTIGDAVIHSQSHAPTSGPKSEIKTD